MLRYQGETDVLFADGTSGDGFSFRWCPAWGAPAFNGGKGAFHEIWEYTPRALGFVSHWEEDHEGGWEEAWEKLRSLIVRGIPVQIATHYSVIRPYGDATSPALALRGTRPGNKYASGHHIMVTGYDEQRGTVTIYEPNDVLPHARYACPVAALRQGWEEAAQRVDNRYREWKHHHSWAKSWSLHDGYGPYVGNYPEYMSIVSAAYRPTTRNLRLRFQLGFSIFSCTVSLTISALLRLTTRRACTNFAAVAGSSLQANASCAKEHLRPASDNVIATRSREIEVVEVAQHWTNLWQSGQPRE